MALIVIALVLGAVIAAPTSAATIESLVDEIKRDLIIKTPDTKDSHYLTAS